jgi:probable F420-dependent oxidoreductase
MKFGIHIFATEDSIQPMELAKTVEERGYDSLWFSEHTHIPVDYLESEEGQTLPDYYWQTYDPFIAVSLAASVTNKIKIGTGISLFLQHDPITLAKTVATVDQISSGRFLFGIGTGWNALEMKNHGISYSARYRIANEYISAMKTLWTETEPEFHGKYVSFSRSKVFPKPSQSPYPPIIAGGGIGPKSLAFIAQHCDGWMPIVGRLAWPEIKKTLPELRLVAETYERKVTSIELSLFAWSLPDEKTIAEMEKEGFKSINISLEAKAREDVLPVLDEYAKLLEK